VPFAKGSSDGGASGARVLMNEAVCAPPAHVLQTRKEVRKHLMTDAETPVGRRGSFR
jgi:hypothetical protein